ncbi:hypothetical protein Rs2_23016 [Raphanus sativus]|uniref:Uncharacterized protein LOC130494952 n=1 Tax=Raphanus sativus TaxID=3726 RepID=A0A9W3BRI9_RAPSA|nr:uncharacterized protein LOC130494952 [Raphanus sativus]KAJ4896222.1 hypothetical protein Rs2_23016 [Raphanus sativus]
MSGKLTEKYLKEEYAAKGSRRSRKRQEYPHELLLQAIIADVDEIQSQLDYHDMACSEKEEKLLSLSAFFLNDGASIAKRLSDANVSINKLERKHIAAAVFA